MNHYLIISIVCGLSFFSLGLKLNRDPGAIDSYLGYRSRASKRNEDTWYEGNVYAGRCLMLLAVLIMILLAITELYALNIQNIFYFLISCMCISLVLIYFLTERHLKDLFFRDGKRKPRF